MPNIYFEILNKEICSFAKKPTPAYRSIPEWWKNMPRYNFEIENGNIPSGLVHRDRGTIRSCPAVNDALNFGYTLFNPMDIFIDTTDEKTILWYVPEINLSVTGSDENSYVGFHLDDQLPEFNNDPSFHKHVIKINTFFGIKTDPGYSCWITHPIERNELPFRIIDAIIDTDKYASRFPYSFFIKKNFKGVIKAGTPLIQVIPFKREDFSMSIIDKDNDDILKTDTALKINFNNGYKKLFWTRKKFN